jgi:hypothetical protein
VPTFSFQKPYRPWIGGHASLCPPYELRRKNSSQ